jgi:hypothetical protein
MYRLVTLASGLVFAIAACSGSSPAKPDEKVARVMGDAAVGPGSDATMIDAATSACEQTTSALQQWLVQLDNAVSQIVISLNPGVPAGTGKPVKDAALLIELGSRGAFTVAKSAGRMRRRLAALSELEDIGRGAAPARLATAVRERALDHDAAKHYPDGVAFYLVAEGGVRWAAVRGILETMKHRDQVDLVLRGRREATHPNGVEAVRGVRAVSGLRGAMAGCAAAVAFVDAIEDKDSLEYVMQELAGGLGSAIAKCECRIDLEVVRAAVWAVAGGPATIPVYRPVVVAKALAAPIGLDETVDEVLADGRLPP